MAVVRQLIVEQLELPVDAVERLRWAWFGEHLLGHPLRSVPELQVAQQVFEVGIDGLQP